MRGREAEILASADPSDPRGIREDPAANKFFDN
jgi:hypothetical protein